MKKYKESPEVIKFDNQVNKHLETLKISTLNEDEFSRLSPFQSAIAKLSPAEHLALALQFKYNAEKYAYKWFWDRATDITDEEEASCFNSDGELLDEVKWKQLQDRVEANHAKLLADTNRETKEILRKFNYRLDDDIDLWEEINVKGEW